MNKKSLRSLKHSTVAKASSNTKSKEIQFLLVEGYINLLRGSEFPIFNFEANE